MRVELDVFETKILSSFTYQEGMVYISENCVLRDNVIDLLQLNNVCLLQDLHSKVLSRFLVPA